MESERSNLKLIDLTNVSIMLDETNDFNASVNSVSTQIQTPIKNLQSQKPKEQHLLKISFNLIQLQSLTPLQPQIVLFQLYVSSQVEIRADLKLSKLFDLQTLSYFMEIQTVIEKDKLTEKGYVTVNTKQCETHLNHEIQINFLSPQPFDLPEGCQSTLLLGSKQNKWPFVIQNFTASNQRTQTEATFSNQLQKPIIKNLSLPNDYSYPFIDRLELPLSEQPIDLQQKLFQLPSYSSPKPSQNSSQQLYICHDMKGGYIEDTNTFRPLRQDKKSHHYRYNYLSQTKIFNYFSHYPITVPPKMWRELCKRYNVLCLGTFIVEPNEWCMDENDFLTEEFALKLVYVARKAQFDGYLINIQVPVQNPVKVVSWLQFLTQQINKAIPCSQIVWYDSILINGMLKYQNQLNPFNKAFYQVCNGIFTNYWWKQSSLLTCLKHKIPQIPIYIGNDCFGRNTYGGGKYEIVNAIKKIQQIGKGELSVALFAPGFTYEDNGETMREVFHQNEVKMYHGSNSQSRKIQKWKITQNGGHGWKQEGDWWVTSFDICKRQALVKISEFKGNSGALEIKSSCYVAGKGPNFADYYKITLQVINFKTGQVFLESAYPKTKSTQSQEYVEIKMELDCTLISEDICVRILEEGKDAQYWAGHYGSMFRGETVVLEFENSVRKWISTLPVSSVNLQSQYTTFFSKGEGDYFYCMGKKGQPKYSSLSDFDIPPVLTLNNLSNVQISYSDAYIGGTCLKFQNTKNIVLNSFHLPSSELNERKYTALIVVKNAEPLEIICGDVKDGFKEFLGDKIVQQSHGWKSYVSQLLFAKEELNFDAFVKFSNDSGLVGQFSLVSKQILSVYQPLRNAQLKVKLSKESKNFKPYNFDFVLKSELQNLDSSIPSKLLLSFGQFSGFINIEKESIENKSFILHGLLRNIPAISSKESELHIQLIDFRNGLHKVLLSRTLSKTELKVLLQNNQISFDFNL